MGIAIGCTRPVQVQTGQNTTIEKGKRTPSSTPGQTAICDWQLTEDYNQKQLTNSKLTAWFFCLFCFVYLFLCVCTSNFSCLVVFCFSFMITFKTVQKCVAVWVGKGKCGKSWNKGNDSIKIMCVNLIHFLQRKSGATDKGRSHHVWRI